MKKIIWALVALPFMITATAMRFLPDTVPLHYNAAGEIDRWGSKFEHFLFPVLILVFVLLMQITSYYQKKKTFEPGTLPKDKATIETNLKVIDIVTIVTELFFLAFNCWTLWTSGWEAASGATHATPGTMQFVWIGAGIIFLILGNIMPKSRKNSLVGIRTEWSMYNDETWSRSNRFGGIVLMVTGIAMIVVALALKGATLIVVNIALLLISSFIIMWQTYRVYKEVSGK